MNFFYLELNPFIVAGKRLESIDLSRAIVYTSSWAISEQLINISPRNYGQVRSTLLMIDRLGISIDWDSNLDKIYHSFDLEPPKGRVSEILKLVYRDVLAAETEEQFSQVGKILANQFKQMRIVDTLSDKIRAEIHIQSGLMNSNESVNYEKIKDLLYRTTVSMIAHELKLSPDWVNSRYNRKLDRYIHAQAVLELRTEPMKRNDQFDAEHFKYLQNSITYMVSDDKLVKRLDSKRVFGVQEFLDYMSNQDLTSTST